MKAQAAIRRPHKDNGILKEHPNAVVKGIHTTTSKPPRRGGLATPFTDIRVVRAPAAVTLALWKDYLKRQGISSDIGISQIDDAGLGGVARNPARLGTLLSCGKPGVVLFQINRTPAGESRVRLQVSYGLKGEFALAFGTLGLWTAICYGWWQLLAMRSDFLPAGRFEQVSPIVPVFGFGLGLLIGFTWTWFTAFRLSKFVSDFYTFISKDGNVHHTAESPLRLPFAAFVQVLIVNIGLLFLICTLLQAMPPWDRVLLASLLVGLLTIATLLLLAGPGTIRWVVGHAAFTAGISCSVYVLLPVIVLGLSQTEVKQAAASTGLGWHQAGALLVLAFSTGLILKAVADATKLAQNIDYWRQHVEGHRWATRWSRIVLALIALPLFLLAGLLMAIAGVHGLLFIQSQLLGDYAWPHAIGFDQAAITLGTLAAPVLSIMGLRLDPTTLGNWLLSLYLLPALGWCGCHAVAFLRELLGYVRMFRLPAPPPDASFNSILHDQAKFGGTRMPTLRISSVQQLHAFTPIPPIVFLPQLIVISTGTIARLPQRCLEALLAHEMGHLRHRHTHVYTCLRLISRSLLLGPSLLTGLIRPAVALEMQADSFAINWLEASKRSRQDLIDALTLLEQDRATEIWSEANQGGLAGGAGSDWLPTKLRRRLENASSQSPIQRVVTGWQLLHFMTFECDLANYVYLSHTKRISLISSLPTSLHHHEPGTA